MYNSFRYVSKLIQKSSSGMISVPNFTSSRNKSKFCNSGKTEKPVNEKSKSEKPKTDKKEKSKVKKVPKIAINGFGRIGRMVMRVAVEHSCPLEIVAINDTIMSPEYIAYSLKYDSTHGRFIGDVDIDENNLIVEGKNICTYMEADPKNIPWKDLDVDYVVEATGKFKTLKKAQGHLAAGAKKVVITAPVEDAPMYVVGVNLAAYDPAPAVVSCASCATNALAPLAKVVHENFGIIEGLMTTIHAATASQKIIDSPSLKNWREGRGGMQNMIPTETGAASAVGKVLPQLQGKLSATAVRVPTANVSLVDLTCRLQKEASMEDIKCAMCDAMDGPMLGIIGVTTDELVSSDLNGSHYSCIYDPNASMALNKQFVKLLAWYDNEYGYACRVIDLIKFMHAEQKSQ